MRSHISRYCCFCPVSSSFRRAIAASVASHGVDSVHWIVARYRTEADPAYLRIANEHATTAMIFSEAGFTDLLRDEAGAHA